MTTCAPTRKPGTRCAMSVEVVNLTESERDALNALIALLTDPALAFAKSSFMRGEMCMLIESGEVTWADAPSEEVVR